MDNTQLYGEQNVPIANIWLLMLYASKFYVSGERVCQSAEDNPDDIPDLIAEYLCKIVSQKLRNSLKQIYVSNTKELSRVRGRIEFLKSERSQSLSRGRVICTFDVFTNNTPRNRYVMAALIALSKITKQEIAQNCRHLAHTMQQLGVNGEKPNQLELQSDRINNYEVQDKLMVEAAILAFQLSIPNTQSGSVNFFKIQENIKFYDLYEKAVAGFYIFHSNRLKIKTNPQKYMNWFENEIEIRHELMPKMQADLILECKNQDWRLIIDTKFTNIITKGQSDNDRFKNSHIYQIYSYIFSQKRSIDVLSLNAKGMLLYPSIGVDYFESVKIQGHKFFFATINMNCNSRIFKQNLENLILKLG